MKYKKIYLKGLALLCLGLALSACDNKPIDSPINMIGKSVFLTTLPQGFIKTTGVKPTQISFSLSLNGKNGNECRIRGVYSNGDEKRITGFSGTTYARSNNEFMTIKYCTTNTEVNLHITYQIGTKKYAGSYSFNSGEKY